MRNGPDKVEDLERLDMASQEMQLIRSNYLVVYRQCPKPYIWSVDEGSVLCWGAEGDLVVEAITFGRVFNFEQTHLIRMPQYLSEVVASGGISGSA